MADETNLNMSENNAYETATDEAMTSEAAKVWESNGKEADFDFESIFMPETKGDEENGLQGQEEEIEDTGALQDQQAATEALTGEKKQEDEHLQEADDKEQKEEATLIAKYNGKSFPLDKAAALKTALGLGLNEVDFINTLQKGMNYDRMKEGLQTSNEFRVLDFLAESKGIAREEFVSDVIKNHDNILREAEISAVMAKFPYFGDEAAAAMAEANLKAKKLENSEMQKTFAAKQTEDKQRIWNIFFKKYPAVNVNELEPEFFEQVNQGTSPLLLMLEKEKKALEAEKLSLQQKLEAFTQNKKNKEKAIGSVKTTAAESPDDFLSGFLS